MNELALFAGAGGGILGAHLLGWRTVCAVELDEYARRVLLARQDDGCLPPFPIWDDIRTFNGTPWAGRVDIVTGGFPCQDISTAGKGAGITGAKSGLWREMARVIGEVRPRFALVENSPALTSRGLGTVLGDLAALGYDARWGVLGAHHAGAPHKRDRIWILADAMPTWERRQPRESENEGNALANHQSVGLGARRSRRSDSGYPWESEQSLFEKLDGSDMVQAVSDAISKRQSGSRESWFSSDPAEESEGEADNAFHERIKRIWGIESRVGRVAHGVAHRMDRLRCIGNGQVPSVVRLAWETLT